ncbi:MAG: DUF4215 domain-containing protein [Myxococcota bacterium]
MFRICCVAIVLVPIFSGCDSPTPSPVAPPDATPEPPDAGAHDGSSCPAMPSCTDAGVTCRGTELVICETDSDGCMSERRVACGGNGCVADSAGARCDDPNCPPVACSTDACDGDVLVSCRYDANGCLQPDRTDCAATGEICSGSPPACTSLEQRCPAVTDTPRLSCNTSTTIAASTHSGTDLVDRYACEEDPWSPGLERMFFFRNERLAHVTIRTQAIDSAQSFSLRVLDARAGDACGDGPDGTCIAFGASPNGDSAVSFTSEPSRPVFISYEWYRFPFELSIQDTTDFDLSVDCTYPTCGDGRLEPGEECDDRNDSSNDGCSATCQIEPQYLCTGSPSTCVLLCGNGGVDEVVGEGCDDGNREDGDGCSATCQPELAYECTGTPSRCTFTCGNGSRNRNAGERCDDGNTASGDGCSSRCQIEPGFACDVSGNCTIACGNGRVDRYMINAAQETCDDGNDRSGDGCSSSCQIEVGRSCTGEPSVCTTTCGNGTIDRDVEVGRSVGEPQRENCDDGNTIDGDGCSTSCRRERAYECSGEPSACRSTCGDGNVDGSAREECDDGNLVANDGCSAQCEVEVGYVCSFTPTSRPASSCEVACGNGIVEGADPAGVVEACDDGNTLNGDGCSATCRIERGFECTGARPSVCRPRS